MTEKLFTEPRWLYRFFRLLERISIPAWLLAVLVVIVNRVAHHWVAWRSGYLQQGQLNAYFAALALLFYVPLAGINRRMRQAKESLLKAANQDLKDIYEQIRATAQAGDYAQLEHLKAPLAALKESRDMIKAVPTWPWQPNTLRNLFAPLLFPIIVFLVQLLVQRVLGG